MKIRYVGIENLDSFEFTEVDNKIKALSGKVARDFKDGEIIVGVKKHEKGGKTSKFSVHLRLEAPSTVLATSQSDWDLARTLSKVCDNLENSLKHKFKKEVTQKKRKTFKV